MTEAGLRDKVKIIVGGGRIDEQAAEYIVPDAYTDNASHGREEVPRAPGGGIDMVDNEELLQAAQGEDEPRHTSSRSPTGSR